MTDAKCKTAEGAAPTSALATATAPISIFPSDQTTTVAINDQKLTVYPTKNKYKEALEKGTIEIAVKNFETGKTEVRVFGPPPFWCSEFSSGHKSLYAADEYHTGAISCSKDGDPEYIGKFVFTINEGEPDITVLLQTDKEQTNIVLLKIPNTMNRDATEEEVMSLHIVAARLTSVMKKIHNKSLQVMIYENPADFVAQDLTDSKNNTVFIKGLVTPVYCNGTAMKRYVLDTKMCPTIHSFKLDVSFMSNWVCVDISTFNFPEWVPRTASQTTPQKP